MDIRRELLGGPHSKRRRFGRFLDGHEDLYMVIIAVIIGLLAGYGNIIFRWMIGFFQGLFYGSRSEFILETLNNTPFYKIILIPAIGGLMVGLISIMFKFAKGHGVPDVMKAIAMNRSISPAIAIIKSLSSAITLGSGGSAGREGPIVQIGAAIGSGVGRFFRFSTSRMKASVACGAAGGLAATFNAPIGGAMFAAEVLLGEFGLKTFSPIIIASVIATAVSRAYLGHEVTFEAPVYHLESAFELPLYALLGLLCAVVGVFFIRTFYFFEERFESLDIPSWSKPALGGLLMGTLAVFSRDIMGVGYDTIIKVLHGEVGMILLVIVFLKILATSFTLGSGGSGGLFVPSLFIGAVTGGFFGWLMHSLMPGMTADSGAYALVAMSAMLAATMRAPLTAILIIFEITQSYTIILPLMLTAIIANIAANWIEKESIFSWILTKQGIRIKRGLEEQVLDSIYVRDVQFTDVTSFHENTPFREVMEGIQTAPQSYFPVLDNSEHLVGMLSLDDIRGVIFEEGLEDIVVAGEICTKQGVIYLYPDDTLTVAMEKMGRKDLGALPVVEEDGEGYRVTGLLRRSDLILAYNKRIAAMRE
ncbi:chloride channel protein [Limisalsivibrio acetivorans]|uniref:chloride channel protein n=1 Tax=Limisalsivibrio acetivorans TaxID=1304888 RepID=UPI0003B75321|nr:chloride channel protein [Limisalsivibrio acetivorans]